MLEIVKNTFEVLIIDIHNHKTIFFCIKCKVISVLKSLKANSNLGRV